MWQYQAGEDCHQLYMELEEEIRFKVVDEVFVDVVPSSEPPSSSPHTPTTPLHTPATDVEDNQEQPLPYKIMVLAACGLVVHAVSWWR